jgi:hypothetical protein
MGRPAGPPLSAARGDRNACAEITWFPGVSGAPRRFFAKYE